MSHEENIIVDASDIKYCVGPCTSKEEETTERNSKNVKVNNPKLPAFD